jgi:hypothetical protein
MGKWTLSKDDKCPICGGKVEVYIVNDYREGGSESHDYIDGERCAEKGCYQEG